PASDVAPASCLAAVHRSVFRARALWRCAVLTDDDTASVCDRYDYRKALLRGIPFLCRRLPARHVPCKRCNVISGKKEPRKTLQFNAALSLRPNECQARPAAAPAECFSRPPLQSQPVHFAYLPEPLP